MLRKVRPYFFGMKCHTDFFFSNRALISSFQGKVAGNLEQGAPLRKLITGHSLKEA